MCPPLPVPSVPGMYTQPDIRLDIADQIHRERMAEAERDRLAARPRSRPRTARRSSRRLARAVLAFAGARIFD